MGRDQENTTMQLVMAVLSRCPRPRNFEMALTQVGVAYRELYKLVRHADEEYWRSLPSAPVVERSKRAKPYRVEGAEPLPRPRVSKPGQKVAA
jgi:hypothetical protein